MKNFVEPIERLINEFSKLPGVGTKTAGRFAYSIINRTDTEVREFAKALTDAKTKVRYCNICGNFTDKETCSVCVARDHSIICVVAEPKDVLALEKVRSYNGSYHVLHGVLSPLDGKGADDIRLKELLARLNGGKTQEIVLATPTNVEGEATAMYIAKLIKPLGIKVTRIAQGISLGTELEYADEVTLTRALSDRREI
ncbi:MAG: recombination mediator RecR [Firmicutes bacterium]|nr:recombination mediator RecR [Bacillota bacterium]